MIFLTVGTQFPFDRLVRAFDDACAANGWSDAQIFAQIGTSTYKPRHFEATASLAKEQFDRLLEQADYVVSHAGMGSITQALEHGKPLLVMPRLKRYGEVVNDHQMAIARRFEADGHLLVAHDPAELVAKLEELKSFAPKPRHAQPEQVAARIRDFLEATTHASVIDQRNGFFNVLKHWRRARRKL